MNVAKRGRAFDAGLLLAGVLMLLAAVSAIAMKPTIKLADQSASVKLEAMIPMQFGRWRVDVDIVPVQLAPDVKAKLDQIYNQTLARTYINAEGQRIMLSIAYGGDQSDAMQLHLPEVCYTSQGFHVLKASLGQIATQYGALPIKRLVAERGSRHEPITYWITVGGDAIHSGLARKLAQLKYGLTGRIPDGMLVRASSIDADEDRAYALQEEFLRELLKVMQAGDRARLAGRFGA